MVTALMGTNPSTACRKGDLTRLKVTTRVEHQGKWLLGIKHRTGISLDTVINELLDRVTNDLSVWGELVARYRVDLFCGLQMEAWNRGLSFTPMTLRRIADRGIELGLDIYYVADDE